MSDIPDDAVESAFECSREEPFRKMDATPPRVSEKIETDAIEALIRRVERGRLESGDTRLLANADTQLASLKAAAQERDAVVERCAAICDDFARTTTHNILAAPVRVCADRIRALKSDVHRDEIDGVLGEGR